MYVKSTKSAGDICKSTVVGVANNPFATNYVKRWNPVENQIQTLCLRDRTRPGQKRQANLSTWWSLTEKTSPSTEEFMQYAVIRNLESTKLE